MQSEFYQCHMLQFFHHLMICRNLVPIQFLNEKMVKVYLLSQYQGFIPSHVGLCLNRIHSCLHLGLSEHKTLKTEAEGTKIAVNICGRFNSLVWLLSNYNAQKVPVLPWRQTLRCRTCRDAWLDTSFNFRRVSCSCKL